MRRLILFLALALALCGLTPVAADFLYPVTSPYKLYTNLDGLPLDNGYIYFGVANQDAETVPVQMYWDAAGTIPASQPIRTVSGYIVRNGSPANIFSTGDHSITVKDSDGTLVFSHPTSTDLQLALAVTGAGTAAAIPIADAGGYYTAVNVETALQEARAPGNVALSHLAAEVLAVLLPTGATMDYAGTTAPTGWVLASGLTIGSASSSATARANADTQALYTLLWNSYSNTELPIQDSAGTPTTRGASASNDFSANKRLPVPDCRGRVRAGKDNMGGSTAGRLSLAGSGIVGTTLGIAGGTENATLTTAQLASHTHTQDAHNHTQNSHTHTQDAHNHTQNSHTHTQDAHAHTTTESPHVHDYVTVVNGGAVQAGAAFNASTATGVAAETLGKTTGLSVNNATATNQATTATNNATTATNQATTATNNAATAVNQSTGGGDAHLNVQPTIVFSVIIKL